MEELTATLFNKRNGTRGMQRSTREDFDKQVSSCIQTIETSQDRQCAIKKTFKLGGLHKPSEYRDAINYVTTVGECCRLFHNYIEKSDYLPLSVVPFRLPALIALKRINLQMNDLKQVLIELKEIIVTDSDRLMKQQKEIQCILEKVSIGSEEVINHLRFLADKARFQEKVVTSEGTIEVETCLDSFPIDIHPLHSVHPE